jgi:site-specific DNA-methyltransferase (adenine-specific)
MEINKIYNENCLDTMAKMPDNFIDLTVTSPPYDNLRNYNGYLFDFESIAKELYRITKQGGVVVWIVGDATINGSETGTSFRQALYFKEIGFNLHDTMIYEKFGLKFPESNRYNQKFEYMFILSKNKPKSFNPLKQKLTKKSINEKKRILKNKKNVIKQRLKDNIIETKHYYNDNEYMNKYNIWLYNNATSNCNNNDKIAYKHPAIFPEKLAQDHIISWSNENDLVYDCFGGSGTTAKMAHLLKRNWILSEISEEYCKIAQKRIQPYLEQQTLF